MMSYQRAGDGCFGKLRLPAPPPPPKKKPWKAHQVRVGERTTFSVANPHTGTQLGFLGALVAADWV